MSRSLEEEILEALPYPAKNRASALGGDQRKAKSWQTGFFRFFWFGRLSFGAIYPTLHVMEQQGWIESRWGEEDIYSGARRRYYRKTIGGTRQLSKFKSVREEEKALPGLENPAYA
jgi:DNA-binding PadR family transcriptional regulator